MTEDANGWRPMSEAPRDGSPIRAISAVSEESKIRWDRKWSAWYDADRAIFFPVG